MTHLTSRDTKHTSLKDLSRKTGSRSLSLIFCTRSHVWCSLLIHDRTSIKVFSSCQPCSKSVSTNSSLGPPNWHSIEIHASTYKMNQSLAYPTTRISPMWAIFALKTSILIWNRSAPGKWYESLSKLQACLEPGRRIIKPQFPLHSRLTGRTPGSLRWSEMLPI